MSRTKRSHTHMSRNKDQKNYVGIGCVGLLLLPMGCLGVSQYFSATPLLSDLRTAEGSVERVKYVDGVPGHTPRYFEIQIANDPVPFRCAGSGRPLQTLRAGLNKGDNVKVWVDQVGHGVTDKQFMWQVEKDGNMVVSHEEFVQSERANNRLGLGIGSISLLIGIVFIALGCVSVTREFFRRWKEEQVRNRISRG